MGMAKGIPVIPRTTPDMGLTDFAVWTERDVANDRILVRKIEPFDPTKRYPDDVSGVVKAKDELDAWRVINHMFGKD